VWAVRIIRSIRTHPTDLADPSVCLSNRTRISDQTNRQSARTTGRTTPTATSAAAADQNSLSKFTERQSTS